MFNLVTRNTFRKAEKICNQKQIDLLFKEGKSLKSGLFRLLYLETEEKAGAVVQVLIAVPKKNLRHAVSRNRMKRLIREAYRHGKHELVDTCVKAGKHCDVAIIFMGKQCISQDETNMTINELLNRLTVVYEKTSD